MSKVLKNYKLTGNIIDDEFPLIKIKDDEDVYADLPICAAEYNTFYTEPALIIERSKIPVVIEKVELLKSLSKLKKFFFLVDKKTGSLEEVDKDKADLSIRLPKDTPVEDLVYKDGEVLLIEKIKGDK